MKAYNVVRFRVKPGRENEFIEKERELAGEQLKGFHGGALVKTGDRTFCLIGEWENFDAIVAARAQMIAMLDQVRDLLEDLGGTLGVTDAVSGEAVLEMPASG